MASKVEDLPAGGTDCIDVCSGANEDIELQNILSHCGDDKQGTSIDFNNTRVPSQVEGKSFHYLNKILFRDILYHLINDHIIFHAVKTEECGGDSQNEVLLEDRSAVETSPLAEPKGICNSNIQDLYNTQIIPWDTLSKYLHPLLLYAGKEAALGIHNFRYLLYFLWIPGCEWGLHSVFKQRYENAYTDNVLSSCHFELNVNSLPHFPYYQITHTRIDNSSKNQQHLCHNNSPMYFLGIMFCSYVIPIMVCLAWFYFMYGRYGSLQLFSSSLTARLKTSNFVIQALLVVVMIPVNIVMAFLFTFIIMPLILMLALPNVVLRIKCIDVGLNKFVEPSQILFLYMLRFLQKFLTQISSVPMVATYHTVNWDEDRFMSVWMIGTVCLYLIFVSINFLRNRQFLVAFIDAFERILPLCLTLWSHGDVILDIIQTKKYYTLAYHKYKSISPMYFILSITSFITPLLLCFIMLIWRHRGFKILEYVMVKKIQSFNLILRCFLRMIDIVIGIPTYLMLSLIFCYILVPYIMTKNGLEQLLKGIDENRKLDVDPCCLIKKWSKGNYNGIFEFYGFVNIRSKTIPVVSIFEQLGEASIQTGLAIVYLANNFKDINKLDTFLGLPFPISAISLTFSVGSFLIGVFRLSKIGYSYCTKKKWQAIEQHDSNTFKL